MKIQLLAPFFLIIGILFIACKSQPSNNVKKDEESGKVVNQQSSTDKKGEQYDKIPMLPTVKTVIHQVYQSAEIVGDTIARYTHNKDEKIEAVYYSQATYHKAGKHYALFFFKNYRYLDSEWKEKESCRVCSGFGSIAKYELEAGKWKLSNFELQCNCARGTYGDSFIPKIVQLDDETVFLEGVYGDLQMGYFYSGTSYYSVDNYKRLLHFRTDGDNTAALVQEGEIYEFSSKSEFKKEGHRLILEVKYTGKGIDNETGLSWADNPINRYVYKKDTFELL